MQNPVSTYLQLKGKSILHSGSSNAAKQRKWVAPQVQGSLRGAQPPVVVVRHVECEHPAADRDVCGGSELIHFQAGLS